MRKKIVLLAAVVAFLGMNAAQAQIFDDFNRANSTNMGPNWLEETGDFRIENNHGRAGSSNQQMLWVGTPNTLAYYDVVASVDVFATDPGLTYVALRTGVGADQLYIKVQGSGGQFTQYGFYHGFNGGAWAGGIGFGSLPAPFTQGRITTYFLAGDPDTLYLDIDTDFNGTAEMTISSGGVMSIAGSLGMGVGIGAYGNADFDNFQVGAIPAPGALALLGVGALMGRRRRR